VQFGILIRNKRVAMTAENEGAGEGFKEDNGFFDGGKNVGKIAKEGDLRGRSEGELESWTGRKEFKSGLIIRKEGGSWGLEKQSSLGGFGREATHFTGARGASKKKVG